MERLELLNRLKMIKDPRKIANLCYELDSVGVLYDILMTDEYSDIKERLEYWGIDAYINFTLWKKLTDCVSEFNYLKISKSLNLKYKWFYLIQEKIPEVLQVFEESHRIFFWYKDAIMSIYRLYKSLSY
jgi:hypothetical protein